MRCLCPLCSSAISPASGGSRSDSLRTPRIPQHFLGERWKRGLEDLMGMYLETVEDCLKVEESNDFVIK